MIIDDFKILDGELTLVCISKYYDYTKIKKAYDLGFRNFGESKLQDLEKKIISLEEINDIIWHFIGRIQSNKIKKIVLYSDLIHSVSSLKHLEKINLEAQKINKIQDVLLQINLTNEIQKDGFLEEDLAIIFNRTYENINIKGLMVIGPHTDNKEEINKTFKKGHMLFEKYNLQTLSMGMSNDFEIALKNNSNCLRIGKSIFNLID